MSNKNSRIGKNSKSTFLSKPSKPSPLRTVISSGVNKPFKAPSSSASSSASSALVCPGAPKKPAPATPSRDGTGYTCKQKKFQTFGLGEKFAQDDEYINDMVIDLNESASPYIQIRIMKETIPGRSTTADEGLAYCCECESICLVSGHEWEVCNDASDDYVCNLCYRNILEMNYSRDSVDREGTNEELDKKVTLELLHSIHCWSGVSLPESMDKGDAFVICEGPCNLILMTPADHPRLQEGNIVNYRLVTPDGLGFRCKECEPYCEPPAAMFCSTCLNFKPDDHKTGKCASSCKCFDCENASDDEYPLTQRSSISSRPDTPSNSESEEGDMEHNNVSNFEYDEDAKWQMTSESLYECISEGLDNLKSMHGWKRDTLPVKGDNGRFPEMICNLCLKFYEVDYSRMPAYMKYLDDLFTAEGFVCPKCEHRARREFEERESGDE